MRKIILSFLLLCVFNTNAQPVEMENSNVVFFTGGIMAMAKMCSLYSDEEIKIMTDRQRENQVNSEMSEEEFESFFQKGYDQIASQWDKMSDIEAKKECEQAKWLIGQGLG